MTDAEFAARLERLIEAFENSINRMGGSINRSAGSLNSLAGQLNNTGRAASRTEQVFEAMTGMTMQATNAERLKVRIGLQLVETFKDLAVSSRRAVAGMYGVEAGFSTFAQTVDDVGNLLTNFNKMMQARALATMSPLGVGIAAGLKVLQNVVGEVGEYAKLQLRFMDQQLASYRSVNEAGAMFGGTLANMQLAAQEVGIGLPQLARIIVSTKDDLANLGFGISHSGQLVAQQAVTVARSNSAMLNLYGSTEDLAKATASYMSLQTQLGSTEISNLDKQRSGLTQFLLRQKELSEITGKRVEQLKEEEQARRRDLAYSLKLGRLGEDARQNVTEGMTLAGKLFGEQGAAYAKEFFATGGKVVSRESLIFASMMPEAAKAVSEMVVGVDESKEQYRSRIGSYLDANKAAFAAFANNLETFAEINYGANNPILTGMTSVGAKLLENKNFIENINSLFKSMEEEARKRREGVVVTAGGITQLDKVSEVIHTMEKTRLDNQVAIDKMINDNFVKMQNTIQVLGAAQFLQIKLTDLLTSVSISSINLVATPIAKLMDLVKKFDAGAEGDAAQRQMTDIDAAVQQLQQLKLSQSNTTALGSTSTSPAAGPPVSAAGTLNLNPVTDLLAQHSEQNSEIINILKDNRDISEKIQRALS
jgi:hypothetical protein